MEVARPDYHNTGVAAVPVAKGAAAGTTTGSFHREVGATVFPRCKKTFDCCDELR
ncbi:MAG: hypothetical protein RDU89_12090 [bacterium]|nr:hypothetical protein [bacterium]